MKTPTLIALALLSGAATAQTLTPIGDGIAQGISADGTTVVGGSNFNGAWRWTAGGGQQNLTGSGWAYGVSGDGMTVFGDATNGDAGAVWTQATNWQSIGGLPGSGGCPDLGSPYNYSDTGDVAVGLGWDGCSAFAYKWTPGGGLEDLGQLGPNSSRANDVSGDGTTIGGWDEAANGSRRGAIWYSNGTEELILVTPSNTTGSGEVWGLSTDGTWACGSDSASGEAFRWSQSTGVELLGSIPGFNGTTGMAISDDGATVVGFAGVAFFGITAWIWTEADGMQRLVDYAAGFGITPPVGEDFQILHDMTPDGSRAVGYYAVDAGPFSTKTPFVFDLPGCPDGAATATPYNGSNINLDVMTPTTVIVGSTLNVTLAPQAMRGPGAWVVLVRDSGTGVILDMGSLLFGVPAGSSELLVGGGTIVNLGAPPHAGGGSTATLSTLIPSSCSLVGMDWYMQALVTGDLPGGSGALDPWFSTAATGTVGTF